MSTPFRFYKASFIDEYGRLEVLRTERYGGHFSVVSLEVENSCKKRYERADLSLILRQTVKSVMGTLRECDLIGMVSDSRFVILLPQTDLFGSLIAIRRIRRVLRKTDAAKEVTLHLGSASYPIDGKDYSSLLERASKRIEEYKESLFVSLGLENKDFWTIIETIFSQDWKDGQKDNNFKLSSLSPFFLDRLQNMVLREIIHSPKATGILYISTYELIKPPLFLKGIENIKDLQTKIFLISGREENNKIPGVGYIIIRDNNLLNTPFILFLRRNLAYGIICKKDQAGRFEGFHTVDPFLVEAIINKFQERYSLQEQL